MILPMSFKIQKSQRLKSEKAIGHLFQHGKSLFIFPVKVQYQIQPAPLQKKPGLQFSVSVSKKNFKRAVDRNLIKRRMREAFRLQKNKLEELILHKPLDVKLMIIFVSKEMVAFDQIQKAIEIILTRLAPKVKKARSSEDSGQNDSHEDGKVV